MLLRKDLEEVSSHLHLSVLTFNSQTQTELLFPKIKSESPQLRTPFDPSQRDMQKQVRTVVYHLNNAQYSALLNLVYKLLYEELDFALVKFLNQYTVENVNLFTLSSKLVCGLFQTLTFNPWHEDSGEG